MKLLLAVVTTIAVAVAPAYPLAAWADHQSGAQDDHQKAAGRDEDRDRDRGAVKEQDQRQIQQGEDELRKNGQAAEQKVPAGQQQISGKVQSAQGDTIVVKTDDDRTITVNIAQVDPKIREVVRVNESITVLGVLSGNQMVAHVIQGGTSGETSGSALPRDATDGAKDKPGDLKKDGLDKQDDSTKK